MTSNIMEKWRKFFEAADCDIFTVIEAAILVAAFDCPNELRKRRDKIAETLFTSSSADANSNSATSSQEEDQDHSGNAEEKDQEDHSGNAKEKDHSGNGEEKNQSENAEDPKQSVNHVVTISHECKSKSADEKFLREKMEASKRRLQQGYQQAETAKKRRTVQAIELQDLPKQLGRPIFHQSKQHGRPIFRIK
ncbi:hypothetical protein SUGI_0882210 [Cryptomeria japonica]|uniref:probable mediator of RNA polymerase II transcription subunit 26b n=1 Tax=Cryptomeria japonica TaxID=3369 RepID=UPI002414C6CF|nr:probable mediator of RNA polymerase II transcription subunit 26b [Cryptomeria japonica]GLJ42554.1 hypothetical protein SUGI_0882210 [Cryptomeria japonica]